MRLKHTPEMIGSRAAWDGGSGEVITAAIVNAAGIVLVIRHPHGRIDVPVNFGGGATHHDARTLAERVIDGIPTRLPVESQARVLAAAVLVLVEMVGGIHPSPTAPATAVQAVTPTASIAVSA